MLVRYLLLSTKPTGKYHNYCCATTKITSCCTNNSSSDHKFSLNKVVNYFPLLIQKCASSSLATGSSSSSGNGNNFDGVARKLVGKDDNNHYDTKMKKVVFPFEKMPTAIRLPVIGTKFEFMLCGAGKKLHKYIHKRHKKLGPIFREPLGPIDGVFISDPVMMREMFMFEGKYPKHPLPEAWNLYNKVHNCKRGLLFMDDEEWLTNRKIMNELLLRGGMSKFSENITRQCSQQLITDWNQYAQPNKFTEIPDLINFLYRWSINVVIGILLGNINKKTNQPLQSLIEEFSKNVHHIFEHSAPLMSISPTFARKFGLKIWTKFEQSVSKTLSIANQICDIALKSVDNDCMLLKMKENGMSNEMIQRIFVDLLIAAGDTTAFSTQWALYLLANNQMAQEQVRQDIRQNPNSFETTLIRGTVREALRLYPVATFIGRILEQDAVIGGYEIKKYTPVLISQYTAGRNNDNFPDAEKFQPCRWNRNSTVKSGIECSLNNVKRPMATMPYAIGSRSCVGQKIANMQMHYLLTEVLNNYELKLLNRNKIDIIMKMIAVPDDRIRIGIKRR